MSLTDDARACAETLRNLGREYGRVPIDGWTHRAKNALLYPAELLTLLANEIDRLERSRSVDGGEKT